MAYKDVISHIDTFMILCLYYYSAFIRSISFLRSPSSDSSRELLNVKDNVQPLHRDAQPGSQSQPKE